MGVVFLATNINHRFKRRKEAGRKMTIMLVVAAIAMIIITSTYQTLTCVVTVLFQVPRAVLVEEPLLASRAAHFDINLRDSVHCIGVWLIIFSVSCPSRLLLIS